MEIRQKYSEREKQITPGQYDLEFYKNYNYEDKVNFKINHYPSERKPDYFRKVYEDVKLLSPRKYIHHSRYENIKTLTEKGKPHHVTNRLRGVQKTNADIMFTVDNLTLNRLDKISYKFYDTPNYWWVIAHANNIFDAFTEIPRGKILRIPPISSIIGHYF